MRILIPFLIVLFGLSWIASTDSLASFIGTEISITYNGGWSFDGTTGTGGGPPVALGATVTNGVEEFLIDLGNLLDPPEPEFSFGELYINLEGLEGGGGTLFIGVRNAKVFREGAAAEFVISGLDWGGIPGRIAGVTEIIIQRPNLDIDNTDDSITIAIGGNDENFENSYAIFVDHPADGGGGSGSGGGGGGGSPIPEPSTYLLFTLGTLSIIGLGYHRRKKVA